MRTLSFHDTVGTPMQQRIEFEQKAKSQEAAILAFFEEHPGQSFSPWGILNILFRGDLKKLNSVRRAMTNPAMQERRTDYGSSTMIKRNECPGCVYQACTVSKKTCGGPYPGKKGNK